MSHRPAFYQLISLPVVVTGRDRYVTTQKFLDGITYFADHWPGHVTVFMEPVVTAYGNLDYIEVSGSELPFTIKPIGFDDPQLRQDILHGDVVHWGPHYKLHDLGSVLQKEGIANVYCTEYSLKTRHQIIMADAISLPRKCRRFMWEMHQERLIRQNIKRAPAVECNGTPTYHAYRGLANRILLYFDTRTSKDLLISGTALQDKGRRLFENNKPLQLTFSGRLTEMKGVKDLIPVALALQTQGIPYELHIYGDGNLTAWLAKAIKAHALEGRVTLHGVVDFKHALTPALQQQTDLFVCCHLQGDPSCTYLETFACGVPIVGYLNEAFEGLLHHADIGWGVPLGQPQKMAHTIATLAMNRAAIVQKGRAAAEFASAHTFEETFSRRVGFYEEVLHAHQQRGSCVARVR
jgi:colanic acid/amylovoran biosynthesis glycosyltransferase